MEIRKCAGTEKQKERLEEIEKKWLAERETVHKQWSQAFISSQFFGSSNGLGRLAALGREYLLCA
ncbi:hypothetical protein B0H12DRAFT_1150498 [Mycena haematopus]|nr:hypothetical protein B0H12DRAFT_1150498 [Mycena haematopus]